MANLMQIEGDFQRSGNKLVKKDLTLLLSERKATTEKKAKQFLIALRGNKKDSYVSSLYPDGENGCFWFEYRHDVYFLRLDDNSGSISLKTALQRA
jgi:hypothetical protein